MRPMKPKIAGRRRRDEGVVAVEFAVILFPLLLVLFGLMAMSALFWTWNTVQLGVDEGARFGMVMFGDGLPPPTWKCTKATQNNGSTLISPRQDLGGALENCVAADVAYNILAYKGPIFYVPGTAKIGVHCYRTGTSGSVACNAATPPDTMTVAAKFTFSFFNFVTIPLSAGTTVPLVAVGTGGP